jgi:hypothetical protein
MRHRPADWWNRLIDRSCVDLLNGVGILCGMMTIRTSIGLCLLSLAMICTVARAGELTLAQEGKSDYVIMLDAQALPAARWGAEQVQKYVKQISGAELPIVSEGALAAKAIVVGPGRYLDELGIKLDPGLGKEGFVLRTVGQRIVVAGPGVRGSLYGCDELLEKMGVRWFTAKITQVPKQKTLKFPDLNETQRPDFEYREPYITEALDGNWAAHNRVNGSAAGLTAEMGGKVTYGSEAFVHTLDALVPRELYATHPEYFPLIKGKRVDGYVQRCLSNPDVLRLAIAGVEQWIRENPDATIFSVSQNDTGNWCQCDKCTAIAKKYGGQSGLYLWFANQVAAAIHKDHPGVLIDTLAYQFTEAPPTGILPLANVRVRLCPISVCEAHPYEACDDPATRTFLKHLQGWATLTNTLYIWHYNTNFSNYLQPFPDFNEFPTDLKLYKKSGVKGVFFEGDYAPGGGGSDSELRAYVMAKLLWNVNANSNALVNEWMEGVYKKAAPPMRAWFDLLQKQVASPQIRLRIFDSTTGKDAMAYLPPAVLTQGSKLMDEAMKLAADDPVASRQIEKQRLGIRYVELSRDPSDLKSLRQFVADAKELGVAFVSEGGSLDEWAARMAKGAAR